MLRTSVFAVSTSLLLAVTASVALAEGQVTISSGGGSYQEAQRKALFDPVEQALGIKIKETSGTGIAEIRVQVNAGAVTDDIAVLGLSDCEIGAREGLYEPIDYSVVNTEGIDPAVVGKFWIGLDYFSTVLAWNSDLKNPPKTWADFWDIDKFPGARSLRRFPQTMLEIALLADGVPPDQVYPLDVDRAFKKIEEIKPQITTWWESGAQSAQLIKDGEVDMIAAWNGRVEQVVKDGAPASFTYNYAVIGADCAVIPRGAPNRELAQKVLALFVSPDLQANLPAYINYGPVNTLAFKTGKISDEKMKTINSSPENMKTQVIIQAPWWGDNGPAVVERWNAMIQQ